MIEFGASYPDDGDSPLDPMVERLTDANVRLRWLCAVCAALGVVVGLLIGAAL